MTNVIEIHGLRKTYRRRRGTTVAVAGLDLEVPEGGVFGFLGPNGSGKTTTIRCVLGLARPTSGSLRLLGRPVPGDLAEVMGRTGSIVETPALFPTMTARENLRLSGSAVGIGTARVDETLDIVGLADRVDDLVKKYSLGMRQRLGLAAAIPEGTGPPHPGRAGQWARPGRDARGAPAAPAPGRRGAHGLRVEPHPRRDRATCDRVAILSARAVRGERIGRRGAGRRRRRVLGPGEAAGSPTRGPGPDRCGHAHRAGRRRTAGLRRSVRIGPDHPDC